MKNLSPNFWNWKWHFISQKVGNVISNFEKTFPCLAICWTCLALYIYVKYWFWIFYTNLKYTWPLKKGFKEKILFPILFPIYCFKLRLVMRKRNSVLKFWECWWEWKKIFKHFEIRNGIEKHCSQPNTGKELNRECWEKVKSSQVKFESKAKGTLV